MALTITRPNKVIREQMAFWENSLKVPFIFKASKSRCYLTGPSGKFMTDSNKLPMNEVNYIKQVKDWIVKEELYLDFKQVNKKDIKYFMYNSDLASTGFLDASDGYKNDYYEIDLKSAYWETGFEAGLIRPDIYQLAEKINPATGSVYISKPTRLACIGAWARRLSFYKFDGKHEKRWKEKRPVTARLWDHVCLLVSKIMQRGASAAGSDFCFFWVDACFVKSKRSRDRVAAAFDKAGFDYKIKKLDSISVHSHPLSKDKQIIKVSDADGTRQLPFSSKNRNKF